MGDVMGKVSDRIRSSRLQSAVSVLAICLVALSLSTRAATGATCSCPTPNQDPCTPKDFVAWPISGSQVSFEWCDTNGGTSKYRVERSADGATNWTTVTSCPQSFGLTSCTDTTVTGSPKTRFYYRA